MHQQRQVAAVIQDHVRGPAVRALDGLLNAPPELFLVHALPGEDGAAGGGNGRGSMVLGGEDIAGRPADGGAQGGQRFDQHGGLDGHVQATGDAGALERLLLAVFGADGHQAGHFILGHGDFLAPPRGEGKVFDLEILGCHGCAPVGLAALYKDICIFATERSGATNRAASRRAQPGFRSQTLLGVPAPAARGSNPDRPPPDRAFPPRQPGSHTGSDYPA